MTDLRLQKTKYHFSEGIVHGWCEKDEDEDEALAGGVVAVPLLLHRLAVTSFRCLRLRSHLRVKVQPRIHCRLLIPGQAASQGKTWPRGFVIGRQGLVAIRLLRVHSSALRLRPPTALGGPSTPLPPLLHHGLATDVSTTIFSAYASR